VLACFVCYGAIFFDRLAPLYLIGFVTDDLPVRPAGVGSLALAIGVGWAVSMLPARWASGRWNDRRRVLVAAAGVTVCGAASLLAPSWWMFCLLRGLGGVAAGTSAPAVTGLAFAASPPGAVAWTWASCRHRRGCWAAWPPRWS
jgi:predicted MFS family arabinose efflux permease